MRLHFLEDVEYVKRENEDDRNAARLGGGLPRSSAQECRSLALDWVLSARQDASQMCLAWAPNSGEHVGRNSQRLNVRPGIFWT